MPVQVGVDRGGLMRVIGQVSIDRPSRCGAGKAADGWAAAQGPLGSEPPGLRESARRGPAVPARFDDQISWLTATRAGHSLARACADGYSVNPWIDGKEKVYRSIP